MDMLLFQEKKIFYCERVCKGKDIKIIAIRGFTLLIRENNESAEYMNPWLQLLVRGRQLLIRCKK